MKKIKPAFVLIATFLLIFFWFAYNEADAGEIGVEFGPTLLSGEFAQGGMLLFTERFKNRYEYGIGYVSRQTCRCSDGVQSIKENSFVYAGRVVSRGRVELGLGASWWMETNRITSGNLNFNLHLGWNFNERFSVKIRHFSNAGTAGPIGGGWNLGQDQVLLGVRF